jgi:hypothetical protein
MESAVWKLSVLTGLNWSIFVQLQAYLTEGSLLKSFLGTNFLRVIVLAIALMPTYCLGGVPNWLDGYFYYDVNPDQGSMGMVFKNFWDLNLTKDSMNKIFQSYSTSFGETKTETGIYVSSFTASMDYLETQSGNLSIHEKLGLLSVIGNRLALGYSKTTSQNPDLEALFQNAFRNLNDGGKCGDIHTYLSQAAQALGFEAVGVHSVAQMKDPEGQRANGHVISHYRDPKTGEFYVQNYSSIFNTHQKHEIAAIELSTRMMAPLVSASEVTSVPGATHIYIPQTALWVRTQILSAALSARNFSLSLRGSQYERGLSVHMGRDLGKHHVGAFYVHSGVGTQSDEKYVLDAGGLVFRSALNKGFKNAPIDEIAINANVYGGGLQITAPIFRFGDSPLPATLMTPFLGINVIAAARLNQMTGKIEYTFESMNHGGRHELAGSIEQKWKEFTFTAGRTYEEVPDTRTLNRPTRFQVKHDKIGILFDHTGPYRRVYLTAGSTLFLLQGTDQMSAVAIQNMVKTKIPIRQFGEMTAIIQVDDVISNRSKDPYFEAPATTEFTADWNKPLSSSKQVSAGAQLNVRRGPKIQPFGDPQMMTSPVLDLSQKENKLLIYLKIGSAK